MRIYKTTITVTVLHDEDATSPPTLKELGGGDYVWAGRVVSAEPVPPDQVERELRALGNDGTFFDSGSGSIEDRVCRVIATRMGKFDHEIHPHLMLEHDLGLGSLDLVELIMDIENEFGIVVDDTEADKCVTIRSVIDMVENTLKVEA